MRVQFISFLLLQLICLNLTVDLGTYYKEYIESFGYKLEENPVITDDGYILSLWHLNPKFPNGKTVFFQHGFTCTAWIFFHLGENSLPFYLLKEGYDIWLANNRGSYFSPGHISKDPKDPKSGYNNYSMDDFVASDMPAMVKYIKERTGAKKMTFIGHSQGTTLFLMAVMHDPIFTEESFDNFISLGTVPNLAHSKFLPIDILDMIYDLLRRATFLQALNLPELLRELLATLAKEHPKVFGKIFDTLASIYPSGRMDYINIYNLLYYFPGGISKINLFHWSQIHQMKKLVYYNPNFHEEKTAKEYNLENLKKWKIKSLVTRSDDDTFGSYQDVTDFYDAVEDKSVIKLLELTSYGHLDVLFAESAINDIFKPIIEFIK